MSKLTTIQYVLLDTLEEELRAIVHEKDAECCSHSDYVCEARSFVRWLVENYKRRDYK